MKSFRRSTNCLLRCLVFKVSKQLRSQLSGTVYLASIPKDYPQRQFSHGPTLVQLVLQKLFGLSSTNVKSIYVLAVVFIPATGRRRFFGYVRNRRRPLEGLKSGLDLPSISVCNCLETFW